MGLLYAQGGRLGDTGGGVVLPDEFESQGVTYTGRRPCFVWFRGELYVIGYYTRPVVRHKGDSGRFRIGGIRPPQRILKVVVGGGTGGSDGLCLAATTFLHKSGTKVLCESNFGNVVNVGELGGAGRTWSIIDNVTAERRVTHVRGYVSMDGGTFRTAWEAPYGLTDYEENIRTTRLTFAGPQEYQNGIPPTTSIGHSWASRMWYAGSSNYPYRLWWSRPGFPQYVRPASFRDTLDRESITSIWKGRNELLVLCYRAAYMVRQFGAGENDFVMEKLDSDVGCINHFGVLEIHNKVWFPSEDGPWLYDGGFRYLLKDGQPLWRDDFKANRAAFENGFAVHDRVNKVYMYATRRSLRPEFENTGLRPGTITYVGYYGAFEPSMAGDQAHPEWTLDMKHRFDSCGFYDAEGELVIGSCDGSIRKQDWTDGDDDGDRLQKEAIIRTGHQLFFEPGDDLENGKNLVQLWYYVESELTSWSLYARGGDEGAWRSELPDNDLSFWKIDVAATTKEETRRVRLARSGQKTLAMLYVPATTHFFVPEKVVGRGFTFELRAVAPVGLEYRGFGGVWTPGGTARGIEERTLLFLAVDFGGVPFDPDASPLVLAPEHYIPTATISYLYGDPAWPITVRLVTTGDHIIGESVALTGSDLAAEFATILLAGGESLSFTITVLDANGIELEEPFVGAVSCVVP